MVVPVWNQLSAGALRYIRDFSVFGADGVRFWFARSVGPNAGRWSRAGPVPRGAMELQDQIKYKRLRVIVLFEGREGFRSTDRRRL